MTARYRLVVDGDVHPVTNSWYGANLATVLRDELGLTATKDACLQGRCGSCTVLLDGLLVTACTVLAEAAVGTEIVTAVGVAQSDPDIVDALVAVGAVQCGYCTPGMLVAIADLLRREPSPDEATIRAGLSGNLCRCTGYGRIVAAVQRLVAHRVAA